MKEREIAQLFLILYKETEKEVIKLFPKLDNEPQKEYDDFIKYEILYRCFERMKDK